MRSLTAAPLSVEWLSPTMPGIQKMKMLRTLTENPGAMRHLAQESTPRAPRPDEDRDVIVHRFERRTLYAGATAEPVSETIWTVWLRDLKVFETRSRDEAVRVARQTAAARGVRAWILDEGYPLQPLSDTG
jgi:hypothetical protein